ncbi:unnamed protein product [Taenia asiatica]|uniref:N_BRCA1_IG domain-containing protein n=1 Tax=Taenia asiatica TaxID=60517 RepID=A0A0R3VY72_TAEAS|nr:unnamed protein product [Taenia asiatica]
MDCSNSEIDAQLLEQFRCLGTDDREELVKNFSQVVGDNVSSSICQNLQKAIGAYFDFNFEANIDPCSSSIRAQPPLFDAKFLPSPHSSFNQTSPLIWCVQNSGTASWPEGTYLTVEATHTEPDLATIPICDKSVVWLPLPFGYRKPVSELSPGSYAHIVVDVQPPPEHICKRVLSTNTPVLGALKLCLPSGDRFGGTSFSFSGVSRPHADAFLAAPILDVDSF